MSGVTAVHALKLDGKRNQSNPHGAQRKVSMTSQKILTAYMNIGRVVRNWISSTESEKPVWTGGVIMMTF